MLFAVFSSVLLHEDSVSVETIVLTGAVDWSSCRATKKFQERRLVLTASNALQSILELRVEADQLAVERQQVHNLIP